MECVTGYRIKPVGSSDSESDGSGDECDWKRSNPKPITETASDVPKHSSSLADSKSQCINPCTNGNKRKVNNIWASVLEEQAVTGILSGCELKHKPITLQDRSCESYDFRLKYTDTREDPEEKEKMETDWVDIDDDESANNNHKNNSKKKKPLKIKREDILVAKKIVRVLSEKKVHLIERVVHVLGAEKAMELLKKTEDVEEQGGMQTKDNARKRTPGGVYLQLLKNDEHVTKKQLKVIFAEEETYPSFLRRREQLRKNKVKLSRKKKNRKHRNDSMEVVADAPNEDDTNLTTAANVTSNPPTISEVVSQEKIGSDVEDGEILD